MENIEQERLKDLILLSNEISEVKDFDVLMERILQSAREFVNCDAGSIYIKKEDTLLFSYTQNDTQFAEYLPYIMYPDQSKQEGCEHMAHFRVPGTSKSLRLPGQSAGKPAPDS